jgi:hypothetical protein
MPDMLSNSKITQVSQAGSVPPMVFICADGAYWSPPTSSPPYPGTGNCQCRVATGPSDLPLGVSQVGFNLSPNFLQTLANPLTSPQGNPPVYPTVTLNYTPVAGNPGDQIAIFTSGDVAPIRLGTGGATPGALLSPDQSGTYPGQASMVAPFTTSRYMGGVALQGGNVNEIIELYILPGRP